MTRPAGETAVVRTAPAVDQACRDHGRDGRVLLDAGLRRVEQFQALIVHADTKLSKEEDAASAGTGTHPTLRVNASCQRKGRRLGVRGLFLFGQLRTTHTFAIQHGAGQRRSSRHAQRLLPVWESRADTGESYAERGDTDPLGGSRPVASSAALPPQHSPTLDSNRCSIGGGRVVRLSEAALPGRPTRLARLAAISKSRRVS